MQCHHILKMTLLSTYIIEYNFDGLTISIIWDGQWYNKTVKIFRLQQTLVKVMSFILLRTVQKKSVCIVKILKPSKNISTYLRAQKGIFKQREHREKSLYHRRSVRARPSSPPGSSHARNDIIVAHAHFSVIKSHWAGQASIYCSRMHMNNCLSRVSRHVTWISVAAGLYTKCLSCDIQ